MPYECKCISNVSINTKALADVSYWKRWLRKFSFWVAASCSWMPGCSSVQVCVQLHQNNWFFKFNFECKQTFWRKLHVALPISSITKKSQATMNWCDQCDIVIHYMMNLSCEYKTENFPKVPWVQSALTVDCSILGLWIHWPEMVKDLTTQCTVLELVSVTAEKLAFKQIHLSFWCCLDCLKSVYKLQSVENSI